MARVDALRTGSQPEAVSQHRLGQTVQDVQALLDRLLSAAPMEGERARPARLLEAMRYATLGGGKRLRPFLLVEAAALFGVARRHSLMAGAAGEFEPCYYRVTDDLNAFGYIGTQRGRPA